MNRLILLVESRIRGDVYVRFGGELPKTHRSNTAGRWMLSLPLKSVNNLVKDARKVQQTILQHHTLYIIVFPHPRLLYRHRKQNIITIRNYGKKHGNGVKNY